MGHPATDQGVLTTACRLQTGLGWSQFHCLPHDQELHLVGGPVPFGSRRHQVHRASATVPHLPTNTASAQTFLFPRNALHLLLNGDVRAPLLSKGARKNNKAKIEKKHKKSQFVQRGGALAGGETGDVGVYCG